MTSDPVDAGPARVWPSDATIFTVTSTNMGLPVWCPESLTDSWTIDTSTLDVTMSLCAHADAGRSRQTTTRKLTQSELDALELALNGLQESSRNVCGSDGLFREITVGQRHFVGDHSGCTTGATIVREDDLSKVFAVLLAL